MTRAAGAVWVLIVGSAASPATPAEDRSRPPAFAVSAERVTVDFVVRDRKDAILRGLSAADVEVYEDGVRQDVESLEFVERLDAGESAGLPAAAPTFVAVAFDRLSAPARSFARDAVLEYLGQLPAGDAWMGVFSIDRSISTLQPFTRDREAVRASLGRLSASAAFGGARQRDAVRKAYGGLATGFGQAHVAPAELAGEPECRDAEDEVVRRLKILDSRMTESFESLERDQQGFATTHALLSLIAALEPLPGRKAILLFSEGLVIPADVEASFQSVAAAANRANVSIYGADAGGLRATSGADETRRNIASLRTRLELQQGTGSPSTRGPTEQEATSSLVLLERNEDTLRFASGSGLGRLADLTGGFLIQDTNDLSAGLADVAEELGAYYVLSYAPRNQRYDGRFRAISVRVKHPHGRLQARKGYLAVKTALPVPALAYEAPALARLEAGSFPTELSVRLRALQFPEAPPVSVVPVVVEVAARGLQDLAIVVLVRDAERQVVAKMSQRYAPSRPSEPPETRPVLFYRETSLSPGSYTLEAIAYDARSGAAGAATATLDVPPADRGHLRASSVIVVGSAEKVGVGAARPLTYGDVLLYPNLGQPLRRDAGRPLTFFVTAWPATDRPGVDARIEVVREGRMVAATSATRLRPDADGRIQLASSLPIGTLAPGAYELRVRLSDGADEETRTTAVPIGP